MSPVLAALLGTTLSFIVFAIASAWYVVPWLKVKPPADALTALVWVHVFRYVALQIHAAQKFGFVISDAGRDGILYGDLAGALVAFAAIAALRYRARGAHLLVWLLVIESVLDLTYGKVVGLQQNLYASANAVTWLILGFYVPALWISLALMLWQLLAKRAQHARGSPQAA